MKPIPISEAKAIAKQYGYDQVMVYARKIGDDGGESMTTYGRSKAHCDAAARIASHFQRNIAGWEAAALTERDADKKRIAELEQIIADNVQHKGKV